MNNIRAALRRFFCSECDGGVLMLRRSRGRYAHIVNCSTCSDGAKVAKTTIPNTSIP